MAPKRRINRPQMVHALTDSGIAKNFLASRNYAMYDARRESETAAYAEVNGVRNRNVIKPGRQFARGIRESTMTATTARAATAGKAPARNQGRNHSYGPKSRGRRAVSDPAGERRAEMVQLRERGLRLAEIARMYGLSRQRVAQLIDQAGGVAIEEVRVARAGGQLDQALAGAEMILEHFRTGLTVGEIAQRTGHSYRAVRAVIAQRASEADREQRRQERAYVPQPVQYSEEQLLVGLRRVARRLEHAPSNGEYAKAASELGLASMQTVYMRFGGWCHALRRAGLDVPSGRVQAPTWHVAACWQALLSVADQLGDPPRYRRYLELAAGRQDLPSPATLRTRLGLWSEIVAAVELRRRSGTSLPLASAPARGEDAVGILAAAETRGAA